jgi:peptide chain release factor subunit 1
MDEIEKFKIKKLVKSLNNAKGSGTSVITIYIPPNDQIPKIQNMLLTEYGLCSNIKSASNRKSVQDAITSCQEKLKFYKSVPPNGLILYCGDVITEEGKDKRLTMAIEPFKAVSRSMYKCDNRFDTEELSKMLENDDKFGFIIIDGTGSSYYTMSGGTREKIGGFGVDLPKKHGRGGQSKNRFARIRQERRHNYVRKVAENATQYFISDDRPNVKGLILAGSAEFKETLYASDLFDPRLKAVVMKIVDIQHSGDVGFNQAIDQSKDVLSSVKLVQEKKILQEYFDHISKDTNEVCFGINNTIRCIEMGAVNKILIWEESPLLRYEVTNKENGNIEHHYLLPNQVNNAEFTNNPNYTFTESLFVDWITENYKNFGCTLELITDKSQEGAQFVRGFGGFGGMLRYQLDLTAIDRAAEEAAKSGQMKIDDFDLDEDFM